jgi:8-oxo-dGTP pyrophosphatase MutT (NUDIX family)
VNEQCGKIPGGGFIVIEQSSWREFLQNPEFDASRIKILLLELDSGIVDLPKGRQDPGESSFACALRELEEETGLGVEDIGVLNFRSKRMELVMYACTASRNAPITLPVNPGLGHPEHWDYWWSRIRSATSHLPKYLKRFVRDFESYATHVKHVGRHPEATYGDTEE